MIFEMTLDHQVVLPLILACVTAHYVAKVYRGGASIYRESLMPAAASGSAAAAWHLRTITDLIKPAGAVVREATTVQRMLKPCQDSLSALCVSDGNRRTGGVTGSSGIPSPR